MNEIKRKKKLDTKRRKRNFLIFTGFLLVIGLIISKGSVVQFLKVLAIEVVSVLTLFFFLTILINKDKRKTKGLKKDRVSMDSYDIGKINKDFVRDEEKCLDKESFKGKNFNWILDEERPKEPTEPKAVSEVNKKPIEDDKDIKAQVANWIEAVNYSDTVFKRIIESKNQDIRNMTNEDTNGETEKDKYVVIGEEVEEEELAEAEEAEDADGQVKEEELVEVEEVGEEELIESEEMWQLQRPVSNNDKEETGKDRSENAFDTGEDMEVAENEEADVVFFKDIGIFNIIEKTSTGDVKSSNNYDYESPRTRRTSEYSSSNTAQSSAVYSHKEKKVFDFSSYAVVPPLELLREIENKGGTSVTGFNSEKKAQKLIDTLESFGVGASILNISEGPAVTRYELQPDYGVKVSKIVSLTDDIALNLAAVGVRIEAPIPGKAAIGIEIPNTEVTPVWLREVIESGEFRNHPSKLAFAVGKDIAGNSVVADIASMPHLLIAGATGSGKSVCINTLITSILYKSSPQEVRLLMVDPKVVELSIYNGIPHLLIPVVTDPKKAAGALNWAVLEMTNRYKLFAENNVRDLKGYNLLMSREGNETLPQIVIIIDELADLMMVAPNDVEDCICRLAQMARAAGMHLVIATQRPSVNVITGVIKANIPSRISFAVSSQVDSRTILDMSGAEKLLGKGDMLFYPLGTPKPVRVQGALITDKEVENIVSFIKSKEEAQYDEEIIEKIDSQSETAQPVLDGDDELLPQVISMVIEQEQASTSLIQRKFKIGYSRAARILDQLEVSGIVGPFEGSKPRKVLMTRQQWQEMR